ncbi:unnamed protein product [Pleuronectes platessa]|uniref:Uncharacterized protein n=1 Tax=Pleuronectes platessa TaxID=8262 RepID=A0A9N7YZD1_PLEPL|nr:unnamed protein product [Pleuronectes platessa]
MLTAVGTAQKPADFNPTAVMTLFLKHRQVLYIPVMIRLSRHTCTNQLRALSALAVLRVIASSSSSHGALSRPDYHHPEDLTELSAVSSTTTLKISRSSQRSRLPPP